MTLTETPRTPAKSKPVLTEEERKAQQALDLLFRLSDLTDEECAEKTGFSRQTFQNRRSGWTRIRRGEEVRLAAAFDVDPVCFSMNIDELWGWIHADRRGRDLLIASGRCNLLLAS